MKPTPAILILVLLLFTSTYYSDEGPDSQFEPILLYRDELPKSVFYENARDFSRPGKIYIYNNSIFIVEKYEGIHIIDNSNPESPHNTGFIHIPGCINLSIKNNILFADNAVDLIALDLTNFPELKELDRISDIFPELTPPDCNYIPSEFSVRQRPANTVIVNWE